MVEEDGKKVHISCHNIESLRVLLPSKISTGNVNLTCDSSLKYSDIHWTSEPVK